MVPAINKTISESLNIEFLLLSMKFKKSSPNQRPSKKFIEFSRTPERVSLKAQGKITQNPTPNPKLAPKPFSNDFY